MPTSAPQTALEAVAWRRLLISSWPWRSARYLLTTMPVALAAAAMLGVPWLVLVARLAAGDYQAAAPGGHPPGRPRPGGPQRGPFLRTFANLS